MTEIRLPNEYKPLPHQYNIWQAVQNGIDRLVWVVHRRGGKDITSLNILATKAFERVGSYWHVFPTYKQGSKAIWKGIRSDGKRMLDAFPKELIARSNDNDMWLEFVNGSTYQVIGADKIDNLMGANPVGVIMSEYSIQDPRGWKMISPILRMNKGWAIFVYTPRGTNHGHKLYQLAKSNKNWFCELLTIEDTGMVTKKDVQEEIDMGLDKALAEQEYYCSFSAALVGAYYGEQMQKAEKQGRITNIPHDPAYQVHTSWDIGFSDRTVIWFFQIVGQQLRFINYYDNSGEGVDHYAHKLRELGELYGYNYGNHYGPWDLAKHEFGSGKSISEMFASLGVRFRTVKKLSVMDGISAVRMMLPSCVFDSTKCEEGITALKEYAKDYDEENRTWKATPRHDWASHAADAMRTAAIGLNIREMLNPVKRPQSVDSDFDPLDDL